MTSAIGAYATTTGLKARLFDAGVTDTGDDTLMGTICDQVNAFLEGPFGCGRVIAPISSATYVLDGGGLSYIYFPKGIRAVTVLTIGDFIGDTPDTVAAADILLRPLDQDRTPGWPAFYLYLSDVPVSTVARRTFPRGRSNVNLTCTAGWAAIPDDLTDVALTTATRAWHARQSGQADIVDNDDTGAPFVSRFVAPFHWGTIKAYRLRQPAVIGAAPVATSRVVTW